MHVYVTHNMIDIFFLSTKITLLALCAMLIIACFTIFMFITIETLVKFKLSIGTKSVLFGVHCFFLHPWFVWAVWIRLYSWTWSLPTVVSFFVHDLGYFGKHDMDGEQCEKHVELGAKIMHALFDFYVFESQYVIYPSESEMENLLFNGWKIKSISGPTSYLTRCVRSKRWYNFALYHSRFYAKKNNAQYSKLCVADKLSFCMTPKWLYKILGFNSGEIYEYMLQCDDKYLNMQISNNNFDAWHHSVYRYLLCWSADYKVIKEDIHTIS